MLPGYEGQRAENMWWAFSTKRQSDYDTPVLTADLTLMHPFREPNVAEVTKEMRSDRATYGKGHEFSTNVWEVARDIRFSRTLDGSSLILGWAFAFAMGKVLSGQRDPTNYPNVYYHTITFFDPVTEETAMLPTTSIVESVAAGIKKLYYSLAVASLTLSAEGFEHLSLAVDMIGSGQSADSAIDKPEMPSLSYLTSNSAVIKMGDAEEDISTRIRSWSIALNNNPKESRGYFPGSGTYRGRMEIGARSIVPSLVLDLDETDDILKDFLDGTQLALDILCEGATIGGSYKHYLRIRFPDLKYRATPIEESDGVFTYAVAFDEETVLYDENATPAPLVQVDVQNTQQTYLTASS
jgi:hypothetical protein